MFRKIIAFPWWIAYYDIVIHVLEWSRFKYIHWKQILSIPVWIIWVVYQIWEPNLFPYRLGLKIIHECEVQTECSHLNGILLSVNAINTISKNALQFRNRNVLLFMAELPTRDQPTKSFNEKDTRTTRRIKYA